MAIRIAAALPRQGNFHFQASGKRPFERRLGSNDIQSAIQANFYGIDRVVTLRQMFGSHISGQGALHVTTISYNDTLWRFQGGLRSLWAGNFPHNANIKVSFGAAAQTRQTARRKRHKTTASKSNQGLTVETSPAVRAVDTN
jgi:hypothetical protein